MRNYSETTFYCMNCGEKGIPIQKSKGRGKAKFHRKKLYCWHCKQTVNHVECKTEEDVKKFKADFKNGVFLEEAKESLEVCSRCLLYT